MLPVLSVGEQIHSIWTVFWKAFQSFSCAYPVTSGNISSTDQISMQMHEVKHRESISVIYNIAKTRNNWTPLVTGLVEYRAAHTLLLLEQSQPPAGSRSWWETASHAVNWIMRSIYLSILFKIIALFYWEFVTSMLLNSLSPFALYLLFCFIGYYVLFLF